MSFLHMFWVHMQKILLYFLSLKKPSVNHSENSLICSYQNPFINGLKQRKTFYESAEVLGKAWKKLTQVTSRKHKLH